MGKGMGGKGMRTDRRLNSLAQNFFAQIALARFASSG